MTRKQKTFVDSKVRHVLFASILDFTHWDHKQKDTALQLAASIASVHEEKDNEKRKLNQERALHQRTKETSKRNRSDRSDSKLTKAKEAVLAKNAAKKREKAFSRKAPKAAASASGTRKEGKSVAFAT
ncbi:hypothetical protein SCHPADRAFT_924305 [Schizopora paradoxa]|uniref:Uncharacterized protein n=1 Tax=Schizopora paradoxa TaxID=27342 RepID=A0A0H2SD39_9AGAM|nr:hypothetical protein SCHPADRAFT_924305 [Schizopora paradoxa]